MTERPAIVQNPILSGFNPDPSLVRVGDDYYLATSTFEWFPGVQIHHSRDLVHWELVAHPLQRLSQLDMRGENPSCGIWAPCLSYCDGTFYLIYTDVKNNRGLMNDTPNYLVTAPAVTGPWSEPIFLNASGFDPSLFHDRDSAAAGCDDGITLTCAKTGVTAAISEVTTNLMLHTLLALPQGVQAMSVDFPGLTQTSLNMGVLKLEDDGLHITFSIRSSIASQKEMLAQRVHAIVEFAGGTVTERGKYPGWQYERDSQFRDMVLEAYHDLTGKEGVVEATHGGLECGLLIEKIPGLDAISMGPELHDVHSVRERLSVPSTERMYELLCEALKRSK